MTRTSLPDFARLTTSYEWAAAYCQRGVPAFVDGAGLILAWTRASLAALRMTADSGELVRDWLHRNGKLGPILAQPVTGQPDMWTFLADPGVLAHADIAQVLSGYGIIVCPDGTPIMLPASLTPRPQGCRWAQWPEPDRPLPLLSDLICAARATAGPGTLGGVQ